MSKRKYAVVGTGGRIPMFIDPLVRDFSDSSELVGYCDLSLTRMKYHRDRLMADYGGGDAPLYMATDFERMLQETAPDCVIVCTMDSTHHEYIIQSLQHGCDVVTEKPMTTGAEQCNAILEAVEQSGHTVRVAFNYRWGPGPSKVRQLIQEGTIGNVKSVNLEYLLNTSHGADYFRRWHSGKENSGGLLVHKSTHHFDLVNWWIDGIPDEVFAFGTLAFYGAENAIARGDTSYTGYDRYENNSSPSDDPFAFPMHEGSLKALYLDAEEETGYIRNRNVFRQDIDIEDTMSVLVKYRSGTLLTYSLVAYCPEEGYRVTFCGDKGRIEYSETHAPHIISGQSDTQLGEEQMEEHGLSLRVIPLFQEGYEVPIAMGQGGHGGGDPLIQEQIFSPTAPEELWHRNAGHEQGAASILVGIAANKSIESGRKVRIADLCPLRPGASRLHELI